MSPVFDPGRSVFSAIFLGRRCLRRYLAAIKEPSALPPRARTFHEFRRDTASHDGLHFDGIEKRSLVVLMIVLTLETFFLPCAVRLPKVIFRKRTLLRIPVFARLFVGSIAGYLKKKKSSFLWVISRT